MSRGNSLGSLRNVSEPGSRFLAEDAANGPHQLQYRLELAPGGYD